VRRRKFKKPTQQRIYDELFDIPLGQLDEKVLHQEGPMEAAFTLGFTGGEILLSVVGKNYKSYAAYLAGKDRIAIARGIKMRVDLTAEEIADLAEYAGFTINRKDITEDELETLYTVTACPFSEIKESQDVMRPYSHIVYLTESPDEGIAPLGGEGEKLRAKKMNPLFIVTTTEYYQQFLSGEKPGMEELRPYGARWNENTCVIGRSVILSAGYGKKHRAAGRIVGFRTSQAETQRPEYKAIYSDKHTGIPAACIKIEIEQGDPSV